MKKISLLIVVISLLITVNVISSLNEVHNNLNLLKLLQTANAQSELPIVHNAIGESKSCLKSICIEYSPPPITCIRLELKWGTKIDCDPGGTLDCQPTVCI